MTYKNRIGIVASGDMGWQGGGSWHTYNSISGHTLPVGGLTKLVVTVCATCKNDKKQQKQQGTFETHHENNEKHEHEHDCPKNWDQSSKAMEPQGIVDCGIKIWKT